MAADEGDEAIAGPGAAFMGFVTMSNLLDKLRLLNYFEEFCEEYRMKPISHVYFVIPTNAGEQFFTFTSLAAWLIRKCGRSFDPPQEFDDPNATISEILETLRSLNYPIDFPPSKLKQGSGEQCLYVVDKLADEALLTSGFSWKKPDYTALTRRDPDLEGGDGEGEDEEEFVLEDDLDAELTVDNAQGQGQGFGWDEDGDGAESVDDGDEGPDLLDLTQNRGFTFGTTVDDKPVGKSIFGDYGNGNQKEIQEGNTRTSVKIGGILESNTEAAAWQLEVERVLPQLKVTIRSDQKDWRSHIEQLHLNKEEIDVALKETKTHLGRLHDELSKTLEKISSREKYLNKQLEGLLSEYRVVQGSLSETHGKYKQGSGGVRDREKALAEIGDELDRVKQEMDERGGKMTDGSPLVKIKQAIQNMKDEIKEMDIRGGVLEHMLLQIKLNDKEAVTDSIIVV